MDQTTQKIGTILDPNDVHRDAIHIAVGPVVAGTRLQPGQRIGLNQQGEAMLNCKAVGIVDPFLLDGVEIGQRFYVFLFPGSITSLRHTWTHPVFQRLALTQRKEATNAE